MAEPSTSDPSDDPDEERRPEGIPDQASSARRRSFRPPPKNAMPPPAIGPDGDRPPGLASLSTSARRRLELALDQDEEGNSVRPPGLPNMTKSARYRLELALDESIMPPAMLPEQAKASLPPRGRIQLDEEGRSLVRSLLRWVTFVGLLTATVGALTGLSYLTGPGGVAHVVVGILASALSVWLLAAAWSFRRVLVKGGKTAHLVNGLGLLRSALLLKAILLFSAMVLGCFTFSIATGLLFMF